MKISNLRFSSKGVDFIDKGGHKLPLNTALGKITNRFANYVLDLELFFLWIIGYIPSHLIRKLFYFLAGIKLGRGSTFHMGARFYQPKNISVGEDTIIGDHAFIDGRARVTIGSHTDIASQLMIYNSEHDMTDPDFKAIEEPVTVGDYCFIGPRVIIMPGVNIGDGAVVAGGAVVTKDVSNGSIVGGVPAKPIRDRQIRQYKYKLGRPRLFQ
ncbi:MAG: Acetyltransferase [Candidatus Collierbacteria bacterium GW2011_GWC2_44_18]|uniref:Acetyltransferase n=2 Tax=Microgenomates group TaxID=1794810 RepID=A0A0G1M767_9BACT|nr:MAG: acetyltransferase [Microgenomates group bacterium GW2011_GWC1_44_10]KKT49526.1 MAG: Acetyltransferase [Candidatus Collierbacteria bacterium GW2011_GWC2_44_18]KKT67764.1 MAG: Acetyltransferase [Candidatus Woesebacteria bacterium GW2011_GWA2_44_33]